MTPEGRVKRDIQKYLTEKGVWFAGKKAPPLVTGWMYMPVSNGMGVVGIPDFCGIYKTRPLYIETKAPGKLSTTTVNQDERHKEIRLASGIVIVADSVERLVAELEKHGL